MTKMLNAVLDKLAKSKKSKVHSITIHKITPEDRIHFPGDKDDPESSDEEMETSAESEAEANSEDDGVDTLLDTILKKFLDDKNEKAPSSRDLPKKLSSKKEPSEFKPKKTLPKNVLEFKPRAKN